MILCLDSGNSRIKWGMHDGRQWLLQDAVDHADVARLPALLAGWPEPRRIMLANVAGEAAGRRIRQSLGAWAARVDEVRSSRACCGVTSRYDFPEKLGVDRWCALVAAWRAEPLPALVIMAGTATTIDALDASGEFVGGLILPGVGLMLSSLAQGTAGLPFADGTFADYPRCTENAIVTGVIDAQAGAIERFFSRLDKPNARCLLSGGYAEKLSPYLGISHRVVHNLPLDGLLEIALRA